MNFRVLELGGLEYLSAATLSKVLSGATIRNLAVVCPRIRFHSYLQDDNSEALRKLETLLVQVNRWIVMPQIDGLRCFCGLLRRSHSLIRVFRTWFGTMRKLTSSSPNIRICCRLWVPPLDSWASPNPEPTSFPLPKPLPCSLHPYPLLLLPDRSADQKPYRHTNTKFIFKNLWHPQFANWIS